MPSYRANSFFRRFVVVAAAFPFPLFHDFTYAITRTIWRRRTETSAKETKRKRSTVSASLSADESLSAVSDDLDKLTRMLGTCLSPVSRVNFASLYVISLSFFLVDASISRKCGAAVRSVKWATFVDRPSRSGRTTVDPAIWIPRVVPFAKKVRERGGMGPGRRMEKRIEREATRRRRKEERRARSFVRAAGRRLASRRFSAGRRFFESLGSLERENLVRESLPSTLPIFFFFFLRDRRFVLRFAFNVPPSPGPAPSRARVFPSHSLSRSRVAISSENTSAASRRIGAPYVRPRVVT